MFEIPWGVKFTRCIRVYPFWRLLGIFWAIIFFVRFNPKFLCDVYVLCIFCFAMGYCVCMYNCNLFLFSRNMHWNTLMRGNPGDLMHTLRRMKMQEKKVQNLPNRALPNVLPKKNTGSIGKN